MEIVPFKSRESFFFGSVYLSNSSNSVILINYCLSSYHDLRFCLEGELLLGKALLLGEIQYFNPFPND